MANSTLRPALPLEMERLRLRAFEAADLDALHTFERHDDVARYLYREPLTRDEVRLGLRREAHLVENEFVKGEWQSELIYAMLATEWPARR